MDLGLNDEQTMLAETAKDVFGRAAGDPGHAPEDGLALRTDVWAAVAQLGLTGLTVPEEYDGAGAGVAEVYAAMSAAGAAAATEPLIDGAYVASWLIGDLGDDGQRSTWLPRIAGGEAVVPLAHAEPGRSWMQDRTTTVTDGALHGTKTAVPVADAAWPSSSPPSRTGTSACTSSRRGPTASPSTCTGPPTGPGRLS